MHKRAFAAYAFPYGRFLPKSGAPNRKMKVLHIVKTAAGAGWVYQLVRVLRSLGIEIVVALPSDTQGLASRYRETGATVVPADVDFPARRPWRLPSVMRRCRELVAHTRP